MQINKRLIQLFFILLFSLQEGRPAGPAVNSLKEITEKNPRSEAAHFNLALYYYKSKLFPNALKSFEKVININPRNTQSYHLIGMIHYDQKDYEAAITAWNLLLGIKPEDTQTLGNVGLAYSQNKQYEHAAEIWKKTTKIDPHHETALEGLAMIYFNMGMYKKAINIYDRLIEIQPSSKWHELRGRALQAMGEGKKARDAFQNAQEGDGQSFGALVGMADMALQEGRKEESARFLNQALTIEPKRNDVRIALAGIYFDLATREEEKEILTVNEELLQKSIEEHQIILSSDPQNYVAQLNIGIAHHQAGNISQAENAFKKAISLSMETADASYNLGLLYRHAGNYDLALEQFEIVFQKEPNNSSLLRLIPLTISDSIDKHMREGTTSLLEEDDRQAEIAFKKVLKLEPRFPEALNYLNQIRQRISKRINQLTTKAKETYEKGQMIASARLWKQILRLDPKDTTARDFLKIISLKREERILIHIQEAQKYWQDGAFLNVIASCKRALKLDIENKEAKDLKNKAKRALTEAIKKRVKRADFFLKRKRYSHAYAELKKALKINPSNEKMQIRLSQVREIMTADTSKREKKITILVRQGKSHLQKNNSEEALKAFQKILNFDPKNKEALSLIQEASGKTTPNAKQLEQVQKHYYEGINSYIAGNHHKALDIWRKALKLDPENEDLILGIAKAEKKISHLKTIHSP